MNKKPLRQDLDSNRGRSDEEGRHVRDGGDRDGDAGVLHRLTDPFSDVQFLALGTEDFQSL